MRKALRLPEELASQIEELAGEERRGWSAVVRDLLEESLRMRRHPGIVFAGGPAGRRARIAGTGLDVWEIIGTYKALGENWDELRAAYPWLSEPQLRAALAYYRAYPREIDHRLATESRWNEESLTERYPGLSRR